MKKTSCLLLSAVLVALSACGGKDDNKAADTDVTAATQQKGPRPAEDELTRRDTARLGGQTYVVSIHRRADTSLPTVTDPLDQVFYDNSVEVSVTRGGEPFFSKTFRKEAFTGFLSEADRETCILLGMAYDESNSSAGHICLAAQVGQPGTGEGPAFTIDIPTDGGAYSIVRDAQQDTTSEDREGEEV